MKSTPAIALSDLKINESGIIESSLHKNKRIFQLGIISGSRIKKIMQGPFGDPSAYLVHGSVIALRKNDADNIFVQKTEKSYD